MNLDAITRRLHAIRDHNDWRQFHSPKNLAMAASVEMAELVEIFQWLTEDQSRQLDADTLHHAGQEVGDVILYLLMPECLTCYRCGACYRGAAGPFGGFDLETHEKHRQHRLRARELAGPAPASRTP